MVRKHNGNDIAAGSEVLSVEENDQCITSGMLGHRALWRAVIMQAMTDIINNYSRTEDKIEKEFALRWIMEGREDFQMVCSMAEYSPRYVQKQAREIMRNKSKYNNKTLNEMRKRIQDEFNF